MSKISIYHNPRCGTSCKTLALIRDRGMEPEMVEYLKTRPTRAELVALIVASGLTVREIIRSKESVFAELGLADPAKTGEDRR